MPTDRLRESIRSLVNSIADHPEAVKVHIDQAIREVEIRIHLADLEKVTAQERKILINATPDGLVSKYILKFGCSS